MTKYEIQNIKIKLYLILKNTIHLQHVYVLKIWSKIVVKKLIIHFEVAADLQQLFLSFSNNNDRQNHLAKEIAQFS